MNEEVTVIITTWNSLEFLKLCIQKLFEHTKTPFNIIISDNGSTDGTQKFIHKLIKNKQQKIIYLRSKTNFGTISALRMTESYISTKYVVLLDSDSVVSPNWLSTFLEIYRNNSGIKAIGPLKPSSQFAHPYRNDLNSRQIWDEIKSNNQGKSPEELLNIYCQPKHYNEFVTDFLNINRGVERLLNCPPELLSGCCLFLDYDFLKTCGGLTNLHFRKYGGHDADRCWRVSKTGGLVMRTSRVYVHHFEGSSLKKNNLNYRPLLYKNNRRLLDLWGNEFWQFINDSGGTLQDLAQKYWLVREILLSATKNQIPNKYLSEFENVQKQLISSV